VGRTVTCLLLLMIALWPPCAICAQENPEPGAAEENGPAPEQKGHLSYDQLLEGSGHGGSDQAPKIPTGAVPVEEVKKLKREVLEYKEAMDSPPAKHPGRHRVLPYIADPQKILTAVGYSTVVKVPWEIRSENGVVVGDQEAFKVQVLDATRVAIFPVRPFWSSNVIVFFKDDSHPPALFYAEEAYGTGQADYYVEVVAESTEMTPEALLNLALTGTSLGSAGLDALRKPVCEPGEGDIRLTAKLSNPDYRVYVLEGCWECLSGCDLWIEAPDGNATILGAYPGAKKVHIAEKKPSRFAERKHREIVID